MKQTILIALLALAGFTTLPAVADLVPAPAPAAAKAAAPENLSAPGKPCPKHEMGGMPCLTMGHPCPPGGAHGDCKHHADLEARIEQLQKRIDALQMTVEMLVRTQGG